MILTVRYTGALAPRFVFLFFDVTGAVLRCAFDAVSGRVGSARSGAVVLSVFSLVVLRGCSLSLP